MTTTSTPTPATIVKSRKPEPQPAPEWPEESESSGASSRAPVERPEPIADDEKRRRAEVRAWAAEHGIEVGSRGRIPHVIVVGWLNDDPTLGGTRAVKKPRKSKPRKPAEQPTAESEPAPTAAPFEPDTAAALNAEADGEPDLPIPSTPGTREGVDPADVAEALQHVVFHGPVADMETRAELFNEGWDAARLQSVEATIEQLSSALDFTLSMWAMESDRARAAEQRAARAELALEIASRPWWKRRAS